jgi:hypothetical protein
MGDKAIPIVNWSGTKTSLNPRWRGVPGDCARVRPRPRLLQQGLGLRHGSGELLSGWVPHHVPLPAPRRHLPGFLNRHDDDILVARLLQFNTPFVLNYRSF